MARILIVDDEQLNRELLQAYLEGGDHELVQAASGEAALEAARAAPPDLVLLDVMMPGVSGYDVIRPLKDQHADAFLPVILITALNDQAARVRGLEAGADEFLTKPVDRNELLVRINNLLSLRNKDRALVRRNFELAELHRFRDEMTMMLVHDLKNPIAVIQSNLEYVLTANGEQDKLDAVNDSLTAARRLIRLVANLLDQTRLESGRLELKRTRAHLAGIVSTVIAQRAHLIKAREITLTRSIDPVVTIHADLELFSRIVENVLDNALRYTPAGGRISLAGIQRGANVELRIGNSGKPVPTESRAQIFEKFAQTTSGAGRMNLGLGLYFCRLAAEAHGGRMWVEEEPAFPSVFCLELPS